MLLLAIALSCPPLAQALAHASAGQVVEVCGVEKGPFVIGNGIIVRGRDGAVLDGAGADIAVEVKDGATLEHVTVRGDSGSLKNDAAAVRLSGQGAVVRDVRVYANGFGIYLRQATGATVSDCEVSGRGSAGGNGIHLWNSRGNRVERCKVHDTRDGIYLSFAHKNLIAHNDVARVRFGIHYMYSDDNHVKDNHLHDANVGAALMFSKRNRFEGNVCEHNIRHGMLFKDVDSSEIRGNQLLHNGKGLLVQQSAGNQVEGNRVTDNIVGIDIGANSSDNVFAANVLAHNTQQVLMHGSRDNRWDGNYWSDYTGEDKNGDGFGDTEYRAGDLAGYLADAYPLVRVLECGPAYDAIRFAEAAFPVLDYPGVTDHKPLMRQPGQK